MRDNIYGTAIIAAIAILGTFLNGAVGAQVSKTSYQFAFGTGPAKAGYTQVLPTTFYSDAQGYGFEPGATITSAGRGCASDQPFFFSAAVPEGNYDVTVTLGNTAAASTNTVKAELRRLMLEKVQTAPGKFVTRTFTVNVRNPQISTGGEVHLKARERTTEWRDWDDKLTLQFSNAHPSVAAVTITKVDVPTLYILGDSTVCDQPGEPYSSWGQMLPRFFKPGLAVANNAESGESLRSSLGARRLDKVLSVMKPGDYLFIQYGHNDQKEHGPGVGAFTTYKADLKRFVAGARSKGGIPVLVTSMNRQTFGADGKITNSLGDYPDAVRQEAQEDKVPLVDLNAMSKTLYEAIGQANIKRAFATGDKTHHNDYGSYELAQCVIEGIRQNKLGLTRFLVDDVPPFDPSHPDALDAFALPPDPAFTTIRPLGS